MRGEFPAHIALLSPRRFFHGLAAGFMPRNFHLYQFFPQKAARDTHGRLLDDITIDINIAAYASRTPLPALDFYIKP